MTWIITADRPIYLQLLSSWNLRSSQGNTGPAGSCQAFGSSPRGGSQPQHDAAGYAGAGGTWPHQHAADSWAYHYGG